MRRLASRLRVARVALSSALPACFRVALRIAVASVARVASRLREGVASVARVSQSCAQRHRVAIVASAWLIASRACRDCRFAPMSRAPPMAREPPPPSLEMCAQVGDSMFHGTRGRARARVAIARGDIALRRGASARGRPSERAHTRAAPRTESQCHEALCVAVAREGVTLRVLHRCCDRRACCDRHFAPMSRAPPMARANLRPSPETCTQVGDTMFHGTRGRVRMRVALRLLSRVLRVSRDRRNRAREGVALRRGLSARAPTVGTRSHARRSWSRVAMSCGALRRGCARRRRACSRDRARGGAVLRSPRVLNSSRRARCDRRFAPMSRAPPMARANHRLLARVHFGPPSDSLSAHVCRVRT